MKKREFIYIAIILAAVAIGYYFWDQWRVTEREHQTLQESYDLVIKNGNAPVIVPISEVQDSQSNTSTIVYKPVETVGPVTGYVSKGLADTLAKALNVATKEIDRLKSYQVFVEGKGKGERVTDTISKVKWLVMKNDPVFDVKVNQANDSIFAAARITLNQAYAPYRKNIFSRWEYRSTIRASDQRVQILNVRDVTKVPKSSRWGIGLHAGTLATPQGISYGVGVGVNYNLISF